MTSGTTYKRNGGPIAAGHVAITSTEGDAVFDALMAERRFENAAVTDRGGPKPARPEPYHPPAGSSLTTGDGGNTGHRAGAGFAGRTR